MYDRQQTAETTGNTTRIRAAFSRVAQLHERLAL